jgi:hypothetical protein
MASGEHAEGAPWLAGAVMALAAGATFLALSASPARAGQSAALVFSPWAHTTDMLTAVRDLDAGLLQEGGSANVLIVRLSRHVGPAEFIRNGIILALDSSAAGCAPDLAAARPATPFATQSQANSL